MADLGNLWFSLGLDDSKFEKQWNTAFAKYKKQANIDVRLTIDKSGLSDLKDAQNILNQYAKNLNSNAKASIDISISSSTIDALKQLKALGGTKGDWAAVKEAVKVIKESVRAVTQLSKEENKGTNQTLKNQKEIAKGYKNQALWVQNLTNLASNYFSLYAVKDFAVELAKVSGEFEKQRVTLQAMIGEMEGADIFNKMKELSVVSPFEFKDLASYAKQLAAFSIPYEELYDTTKRLADVSAGLGVDMSRIILAYGQIKSAGVLRGTELRQLTEAGVPILDELAKKISAATGKAVTMGDIFDKVSQKAISFEMVKDVFEDITSAGGKFYNMQEVQAETLSGKISNLKDAYAIMLSTIGQRTEGELKGSVEFMYKLIENWETLGRVIMVVFASISGYQIGAMFELLSEKVSKLSNSFGVLYEEARKSKGAISSVFTALRGAGGWGAIIAIAAGIAASLWQWYRAANMYRNEMEAILGSQETKLDQEKRAFEELTTAIDGATKGSHNRQEAINEFNNRYGAYLQRMITEKSTANELAIAYNNVAKAMENKAKQEALSKAQAKVEEEYGSAIETRLNNLRKELKEKGLSGDEAKDVLTLLKDYYAKGGARADEINKIITDRIGKDLYKKTIGATPNDALQQSLTIHLRREVQAYEEAMRNVVQEIDTRFGSATYSTKAEADMVKRINDLYKERIKNLGELSPEEYQKKLKEYEELKLQELAEGYSQLGLPEIADSYIKQWEKLRSVVKGWREDIKELATDKNVATTLAPETTEDWFSYVERIQKEYKTIETKLKNIGTDPSGQKDSLKAEKAFLELLSDKYKFALNEKKAAKDAKEAEKERVTALKEEYSWVLKVYDAYKKYKEQGLSDKDAKNSVIADFEGMPASILAVFQDEHIISDWFDEELRSLAAVAAKGGSDIGNALSVSILQKLGKINSDEALEILTLKAEVEKELSKWGLEDFALKGEGITLDIFKILRDQSLANNEVAAKRNELLKKTEKLRDELGDEWYNKEVDRINNLYNLEISNNKKIAQEKINDLAEKYAKELMNKSGVSDEFMSSLSDKSIKQLKEAEAILDRLTLGEIALPEGLSEGDLEKLGVTADELKNLVKSIISLKGADVDSEIGEKAKKNLKDALSAAKELVGSLRGFAKENSVFAGVLDFVETGLDVASSLAEGNFLKAGIQFITGVLDQIAAAKQYREEMVRAANGFRDSITLSRREMKIAGEEFATIFGEDVMSALEADSEAISDIIRQLKNATTEVSNMRVVTRKGFWGIGVKTASLKDLAPQLFNADGSVNYSYLDEFLSVYGDKLNEGQKAILENLQNTYEQYEDAISDINDYLSNIFSDTASTIADRMIEAFAATGNAATDLGDLVNEVAKNMAKDLIQSLLIEQYLTPAMDRIKALYNPQDKQFETDSTLRTQKAILAMQDAISSAQAAVPEVNKLLEGLQNIGIDLSSDASNASEVLSGLTEDQQNLLMGYINGIRADVSINKGLLNNIVNSVGTISNNIATAIVVWKQIEANTHRSADGVDRIIGYFDNLMGPYDGGGGQALRVNIA